MGSYPYHIYNLKGRSASSDRSPTSHMTVSHLEFWVHHYPDKTDMKLVLVGDANYSSRYIKTLLLHKNDPSIIFTGSIYNADILRELWCNCFAYVHGNEVGGTNPALLEALACGNCVLAINVPYNKEVIKDSAILYEQNAEDLSNKMRYIIQNPNIATKYRKIAPKRIHEDYTWDKIINKYESLFFNIKKRKSIYSYL